MNPLSLGRFLSTGGNDREVDGKRTNERGFFFFRRRAAELVEFDQDGGQIDYQALEP